MFLAFMMYTLYIIQNYFRLLVQIGLYELQIAHNCNQIARTVSVEAGAHNEKERRTLNTAREPTFRQKST